MMKLSHHALAGLAAGALAAVGLVAPAAHADDGVANDLIISEYIEGTSNNKALEIANLTANPIDLAASGYSIKMYFNGNTAAGTTINLSGTVAAGDVHVLANSSASPAVLALADQTSGASFYNGDDAIVLEKAGAVIDSLGVIGTDPGAEWGSGLTSTADNTLRRNADVCAGDTNTADAFDPALQWTGFATDTFDGLGAHTADCEPGTGGGDGGDGGDPATCESDVTSIGAVQGSGNASPLAGSATTVRGVVVGDFQVGGFNGYYLQDAGDNDPATSDGIFVYAPGGIEVDSGDLLTVTGDVSEFFGLTEITATDVLVCDEGVALPAPTVLELPATTVEREALEGMYVTLPQDLAILEYFNFGRFGEIALGTERQYQPTATFEPGSDAAEQLAIDNVLNRITVDDGRSFQNPDPAIHPNGEEFTLENTFRGGDLVQNVTGVLDYRNNAYKVQPTQGADFTVANPRPALPEVGGSLHVASFNVLNYFTSIGTGDEFRGANTQEEFERQEAKIVAALAEIDADIVGLIEIENNDDLALTTLVAAVNDVVGAGTYAALETGTLGTDAITTAFMYKPASVELVGDFKVLDETVDARFDTAFNRPALAQTFAQVGTDEEMTVVVNHLKSKGSDCDDVGDPDAGDGQGNCNGVRTAAAEALVDWLATGPTGAEPGRDLIIGDLNAYDKEDPIQAITDAGYTDLLLSEQGEDAYTYVFDGQLGYLDHALAAPGLMAQLTGAAAWNINADEPSLIDYDMTFKQPAQDDLFAEDPYRSSDHDPVIVGFDFVAPELEVEADPSLVFPPNNKWRTVDFDITASDDSGEVDVELVEIIEAGHKADSRSASDDEAEILARQGTSYTFVFEATDPSGNTTTQEVTVRVLP
jgi:predicted extracellular nuclease